jgi:cytochrome P450
VTRLCANLLDRLEGRREFDFLEEYGAIIPPTVILALIGFPEGHEDEWRRGIDSGLSLETTSGRTEEQTTELTSEAFGSTLFQILPGLIEERRRAPQDDLMSVLVNSDLDEGGTPRKLTDEEIFSFVLLLSAAGTETVARLLGWVGVLLDRHPGERSRLVEDPSLIPNAIEECLRYEAPSPEGLHTPPSKRFGQSRRAPLPRARPIRRRTQRRSSSFIRIWSALLRRRRARSY